MLKKLFKRKPKEVDDKISHEQLGRMMQNIYESGYIDKNTFYKMSFLKGVLGGLGGVVGATFLWAAPGRPSAAAASPQPRHAPGGRGAPPPRAPRPDQPPRHRAARELVDDQHLSVLHDVVHVLLEQGVRAQELVDDVERLALRRILALDCLTSVELLLGRHVRMVVDPVHLGRDVGQHELVGMVRRHEVDAGIRQVHRVPLLVEHVEQVVLEVAVHGRRGHRLDAGA